MSFFVELDFYMNALNYWGTKKLWTHHKFLQVKTETCNHPSVRCITFT